jgi:hypothetical protein
MSNKSSPRSVSSIKLISPKSTSSSKKTSPMSAKTPTQFDDVPNDLKRIILNKYPATNRAIRSTTKKYNSLLQNTGKIDGQFLTDYLKNIVNKVVKSNNNNPNYDEINTYEFILIPTKESKLTPLTLEILNIDNKKTLYIFDKIYGNHSIDISRTGKINTAAKRTKDLISHYLDNLSSVKVSSQNKNEVINSWNNSLKTRK